MRRFFNTFSMDENTKILDVGGTPFNWTIYNCNAQITLLNLYDLVIKDNVPKNIKSEIGNGTALKYENKHFNICFSNSVIEHLGTLEQQKIFAKEILRVGKKIWVQTPAKSFLIEPHLITPVLHYLPHSIQKHLIRYFSVWGLVTKPSKKEVSLFLSEVRLLSFREMQKLFPGYVIIKEKFFFFTKSYIACKI